MEKTNGGTKHDEGKRQWHLLPFEAVEEVLKVLEFGATKYDAYNWTKGFAYTRLINAAFRHLTAFIKGENNDPETGLSHIAHAICCLLFLLTFIKRGGGSDDRFWGKPSLRTADDTAYDKPHNTEKTDMADQFAALQYKIVTKMGKNPILKRGEYE